MKPRKGKTTEKKTGAANVSIKLTPNQHLALISMKNNGNRTNGRLDWKERETLQYLGLIEERQHNTPAEMIAGRQKMALMWEEAAVHLRAKDANKLDAVAGRLDSAERDLNRKNWWLTEAALEYLAKGTATITR